MGSITQDVRFLLLPTNPFVTGSNAGRPAPAHVLNGFAAADVGYGDRGSEIVALMRQEGVDLSGFGFSANARWASDPKTLRNFQADLVGVFSPDGRVFPTRGSPAILHQSMTTLDASDDGFGPHLAGLMEAATPGTKDQLRALLTPIEITDPLTAMAKILVEDTVPQQRRSVPESKRYWYLSPPTKPSALLRESIANFILALLENHFGDPRPAQIQHLSRGLYFALVVTCLHSPVAINIDSEIHSVHELTPLVTLGGLPPGDKDHPLTRASGASFRRAIQGVVSGLELTLVAAVEAAEIPSTTPKAGEPSAKLISLLADAGITGTRAQNSASRITDAVTTSSRRFGTKKWVSEVISASHPEDDLATGLRSMGRKVGFISPDRGMGFARFGLETPLLGTIVRGLVPSGGVEFESFVDSLRRRFGLVLGPGGDDQLAGDLPYWQSAGTAREMLRTNQESFRRRLIRSGLAREYSDGYTEVTHD